MPLRSRPFDVLVVLVERAGRLVNKAELLDLVWPGLVVEENNIAAQVAALRKALGSELIATVGGRGYRFTADVTLVEPEHPTSSPDEPAVASSSSSSLPAPHSADASRLIGRTDESSRLLAALAVPGCVTLVGPGGVGKTVLAREAWSTWRVGRRAWVDLAALTDDTQLPGALYRALGVAATGPDLATDPALATVLSDGPRLVVLDNAEHVVDAVAALAAALLAMAPLLTLLVTSQLPLHIDHERVQAIEPLGLPAESLSDDESATTPAVQLLVARLDASDTLRAMGRDARPVLRRLCIRLDGLPLALEMAAAMVPMLGLQGVLDALDRRFTALRRGKRDAMPRHQTLRAAVEWSHGLLEPDAQRVLRRLGVFSDAFPLDLAVAAAGDRDEDRWSLIDILAELVERSLVVRLPATAATDAPRFRLLETMRSFALDALRASGEGDAVRLRAVVALTDLLRRAAATDTGARVAAELAHVPDLATWARGHAPVAAIELTLAASKVAVWTPWLGEAARWIDACESLLDASVPPALQGEWWRELARFQTFVRGRRTVEAATHACAIERTLGNDDGLFWSLIPLLRSCVLAFDAFDACRDEAQALLDRHREWPARPRVVFSGSLAMEYRRRGDFASALPHSLDEFAEAERAGLREVADNAQSNLAATLLGTGRRAEALTCITALLDRTGDAEGPLGAYHRIQKLNVLIALRRLDEAWAFAPEAWRWGRRYDVLDIVQVLAQLAALHDRVALAALLLGHYRRRLAERGADLPLDFHSSWREATEIVAGSLDAATVERSTARGDRLTAQEVDAEVLHALDVATEPPLRTRTA